MQQREKLSSRLGFILLSAGCAIGLGNVWKFPFITGLYGGAVFVIIYLVFLVIFGVPIMTMEFSVGRASQKSVAKAFHELEPKGSKWHVFSWPAMAGNYLLMMFYTTVSGWLLAYLIYSAQGRFVGLTPDEVGAFFGAHVSSAGQNVLWMVIICILGFGICIIGLQKGVEQITKVMMSALLLVMVILAVRSITLPGGMAGLEFYLKPSLQPIREYGLWTVIFAAMGQSFFTLSLGIGSMAIFGSYINRDRSLTGEAINITILDTAVALLAGLIIFPACFAFGGSPDAGPPLIFITLPNIFNSMAGGRVWGTLFFVFMVFAALSTVVAVFENIIAFAIDKFNWSRTKACAVNAVALIVLSLPCALGFNAWSGMQPFGEGSVILDLEDFIVSNNLLPLGALVFLLFCVSRYGWNWKNFIAEADAGKGIKFPVKLRPYFMYGLPVLIILFYVFGIIDFFS
ncbi:MAG: sodium-dependent transporter [Oscillospiraceae bacterium]|nr:sodium-dependent transporter [Oscillospiraceae bacterium]